MTVLLETRPSRAGNQGSPPPRPHDYHPSRVGRSARPGRPSLACYGWRYARPRFSTSCRRGVLTPIRSSGGSRHDMPDVRWRRYPPGESGRRVSVRTALGSGRWWWVATVDRRREGSLPVSPAICRGGDGAARSGSKEAKEVRWCLADNLDVDADARVRRHRSIATRSGTG